MFADIQNMYHSAKNLYKARVNFPELLDVAVGERQLVRAVAYVVKGGETEEEQAFFDALTKTGFELKMKDLQVFAGGAKKADWDVGLAVDAIAMSKQLDVVVLISGDGDFVPLVQYLQAMGIIVEVVSFGRSTSLRLKEATHNYYDLDENAKVLLHAGSVRLPSRQTGQRSTESQSLPARSGQPTASERQRGEQSRKKESPSPQRQAQTSQSSSRSAKSPAPKKQAAQASSGNSRGTFMTRTKK